MSVINYTATPRAAYVSATFRDFSKCTMWVSDAIGYVTGGLGGFGAAAAGGDQHKPLTLVGRGGEALAVGTTRRSFQVPCTPPPPGYRQEYRASAKTEEEACVTFVARLDPRQVMVLAEMERDHAFTVSTHTLVENPDTTPACVCVCVCVWCVCVYVCVVCVCVCVRA
jgi:hypothetical protein